MRVSNHKRQTNETTIAIDLALDGTGKAEIATGIGFFDHMLDQIARHATMDLTINATGDYHVDDHHTIEDTGIVLGQALLRAVGDKKGIMRYGEATIPMDDTLTRVVVDFSDRPFLVFRTEFSCQKIGTFDTELVREFFQAVAMNARINLHIETFYGVNSHHIAESCFKAFARALKMALRVDPALKNALPSTKGSL